MLKQAKHTDVPGRNPAIVATPRRCRPRIGRFGGDRGHRPGHVAVPGPGINPGPGGVRLTDTVYLGVTFYPTSINAFTPNFGGQAFQ